MVYPRDEYYLRLDENPARTITYDFYSLVSIQSIFLSAIAPEPNKLCDYSQLG